MTSGPRLRALRSRLSGKTQQVLGQQTQVAPTPCPKVTMSREREASIGLQPALDGRRVRYEHKVPQLGKSRSQDPALGVEPAQAQSDLSKPVTKVQCQKLTQHRAQ